MYEQGKYCPTTCGVADYMFRYLPGVSEDLTLMQDQLETIANLTVGADEKITYMRDSTTSAQKSSQPGNIHLYFVCYDWAPAFVTDMAQSHADLCVT